MKRSIALTVCMFLLVVLFAGCGGDVTTSSGTSDSNSDNVTGDVSFLDEHGESKYDIIRPSNCNEIITKASTTVFSAIKSKLKISPKNLDDSKDGSGEYEILIGETNRPETETAKKQLNSGEGGRYNDYIICSIGTKIVILGASDNSTLEAANYFVDNYLNSATVTGGIKYLYTDNGEFATLAIADNNIRDYCIVRPHYNNSYIVNIEIEKLQKHIFDVAGYELTIIEDTYADESDLEIVVGDTNRSGVEDIRGYDEFSIKVDGNKVYLNGGSYYSTAMAVSEFTKLLQSGSTITSANSVYGDYRTAVENYDKSQRLIPTWSDEFNGSTYDKNKWSLLKPGEGDSPGHNGKLSVRSDDPKVCYVKDGKFTIAAAQDDKFYYGGMLRSLNKFDYLYGYLEMSAIIPDGDGFWSCIWMASSANKELWYPEVDVNECYGNAVKVEGNYHSWPTHLGKINNLEHFCGLHGSYTIPQTEKDDKHFGLAFHTYGFMWTPEWIGGTVDGHLYQQFDITQDDIYIDTFNDPMYLMISLANNFANCPIDRGATEYEWENTNKFIVENVYIYQYYDGKHQLNGKVVK